MSIWFMPRDRQLLLFLGVLMTVILSFFAISLVIYQTAASSVHMHTVPRTCRKGALSATFLLRSGMGNLMFQYASAFAIAQKRGLAYVLPRDLRLRDYFRLSNTDYFKTVNTQEWRHYNELKSNSYDDVLVSKVDPCYNNMLVGYFQSYRYFDKCVEQIREAFQFQEDIEKQADYFLSDSYKSAYDKPTPSTNIVYIGIHVRRGDFVSQRAIEFGYVSPGKEYYTKAVKHYLREYSVPEKQQKVLFIVTSDDIDWAEDTFDDLPGDFAYSRHNPDYLDLAILTHCNHTVISVGTFSWWAGWLAHGDVVYFRGYPAKNSRLERSFSIDRLDYYPPHWIGLQ